MHVLMFGWEFPPFITGGLGTACHGLSLALSQMVAKITFVLPKVKGYVPHGQVDLMDVSDIPLMDLSHAPEWLTKLDFLYVDSPLGPYQSDAEYQIQKERLEVQRRSITSHLEPIDLSGDYGHNLFDEVYRYAQLASQIVKSRNFDVIHAHDWMTFLAGMEAKRLSGKRLIVHVHALECDRAGDSTDSRVVDIEGLGMKEADHIIAVSNRTKALIVERYGIDPAKITVVHNGISAQPRDLRAHDGQRRLTGKTCVFLGRITQQKGPEYFLEAAYLVAKKNPHVRFVMAGAGDLLPNMVSRMAELRLINNFHFTGFVNEAQRHQLLSEADLFVMPSVSEPFGLTPLEAIQYGVPVIVTKQSGVSEVLKHAIKVDFWDVRKIADAILKVLSLPSLSDQLREGGPEDLAQVSWGKAAEKVLHVYREVV